MRVLHRAPESKRTPPDMPPVSNAPDPAAAARQARQWEEEETMDEWPTSIQTSVDEFRPRASSTRKRILVAHDAASAFCEIAK